MPHELPHSANCLVCGRGNPAGLRLSLFLDPALGQIQTELTPDARHVGFEGIVHGGVLATVLDEAMVWAAIVQTGRGCYAAEMNLRFRHPAEVGRPLRFVAQVTQARPRLIQTTGRVTTIDATSGSETLIAESTGKYMPMPAEPHRAFLQSLIDEPSTRAVIQQLFAQGR